MTSPPLAVSNGISFAQINTSQIGTIVAANPSMYTITANPAVPGMSFGQSTIGSNTVLSTAKNMRTHLFKVEIGEYDSTVVTAMIKSINFHEDNIHITFLLDDHDIIRQAFAEYHSFRLSYLDTAGNVVETYEITTDPLQELRIILPSVDHNLGDVPNWKIILKNYTTYKVT